MIEVPAQAFALLFAWCFLGSPEVPAHVKGHPGWPGQPDNNAHRGHLTRALRAYALAAIAMLQNDAEGGDPAAEVSPGNPPISRRKEELMTTPPTTESVGAWAFTPGPWWFAGPPHNIAVWFSEDDRVCFMTSDGPTEANARLIAASPTMHAFVAKHAAAGDAEALRILESINAPR